MVPNLALITLRGGGNLCSNTFLQNGITEDQDFSQYGSESNVNYDEGRISEISGRTRFSLNTGVGDQNLCCLKLGFHVL